MSWGRKLATGFLSSILTLILFAFAIDAGFLSVASQPDTIKSILNKSGIYNSVVPGLLNESKTIDSSGGQIPLNDPIVRSAATSAITPQYLQTNVNQAIDSIYVWLNGKSSQPQFSIQLNDVKNSFADKVAAGVKLKAAALPACATVLKSTAFDAFNATCLPRGVTPDTVAAEVRSSIISGQGFLDNATVQASDLKSGGSNKPVFSNQLKDAPAKYQDFKKTPFALGLLGVTVGGLMVLIYKPRSKGLRHLGFILAGTGLLIVLFGLGLQAAVSNKVIPNLKVTDAVLQSSLRSLLRDLVQNLSHTYMMIGGVYIGLGAAAFGAYHYFYKKQPAEAAEPPEPVAQAAKATEPAKAPAKKIKIQ